MTAAEIYRRTQQQKLLSRLERLPVNIYVPLPTEWAEENRYIPPGVSDYYGPMTYDVMPQLREVVNNLHPDSDIKQTSFMKSVQSGGTTGIAETAIGMYIKYKLGSILYLTSTKDSAKTKVSSSIDPMIDYSGLSDSLKPISGRSRQKTADTALYKEFAGGIKFLATSYGSIADLKSNTFHLLIKDEWDEAGAELKDQGDIEGIIHGRTKGVRNYKILDISTPSRMETSRIYNSFLQGDQRYYYVPCPLCGEFQVLTLKGGDKDYGLTFSMQKDKKGNKVLIPETVRYICRHCKGEWHESQKANVVRQGEWRPTVEPLDPHHRSYHSSGLMVNELFLSWERICQDFINTDFGEDILKFKDFMINDLGWPWASVEKHMEWTEIRDRADGYAYGEVPQGEVERVESGELYRGPLILTGGVDVQKDRLELHVVGFGPGMEKWSVDYKIFYGNTANIDDPCWLGLHEWVYGHTYKIVGEDSYISKVAIDSGYDPRAARGKDWAGKSHIVYDFVAPRTDRFIAVMGFEDKKAVGLLKEARTENQRLTKRVNVYVSLIKEMIMSTIDIAHGPGATHFPRYTYAGDNRQELPDEHYRQFLSERYQEIKPKEFGWKKIYKRNEVWDTFIYAIAAAEYIGISSWTQDAWVSYYYQIVR